MTSSQKMGHRLSAAARVELALARAERVRWIREGYAHFETERGAGLKFFGESRSLREVEVSGGMIRMSRGGQNISCSQNEVFLFSVHALLLLRHLWRCRGALHGPSVICNGR